MDKLEEFKLATFDIYQKAPQLRGFPLLLSLVRFLIPFHESQHGLLE